jgi:hypothetical protein
MRKNKKILYELHPVLKRYIEHDSFLVIKRKFNADICFSDYFLLTPALYELLPDVNIGIERLADIKRIFYPIFMCVTDDIRQIQKDVIMVRKNIDELEMERIIFSDLMKLIIIKKSKSVEYYEICACILNLINDVTHQKLKKEFFNTEGKITQEFFANYVGLSRGNIVKGFKMLQRDII